MRDAAFLEFILQQFQKANNNASFAVSSEGMDVDQPAAASTPKKPNARGTTRKTANQKTMELKERDVRALIRGLQRWGDIRQRYDIIVCLTFSSSCLCSAEQLTQFRSRNLNFKARTRA